MSFEWTTHPDAEALVDRLVEEAISHDRAVSVFDQQLRTRTSTRLINWLDHVIAPITEEEVVAVGFRRSGDLWRHPGAQLPALVPGEHMTIGLRVDDVIAFTHAHDSSARVEGSPGSGLRTATIPGDVTITGVERRSWSRGLVPQTFSSRHAVAASEAWRLWNERRRPNVTGAEQVSADIEVASRMVELVGTDIAASYVLEIERGYWQRRNLAGTIQHFRQDRLGLGWGNNDHHTFRSSRAGFRPLVQLFGELGFVLRERFYAGDQAGWGAQVLEHPGCGGVLFTDVDLEPDEVDIDFSTTGLREVDHLGTVGLWCALHGESILGAGMHHLEGQFEFDLLRDGLAGFDIGHMKPFSDFPHLRQAFTRGERWAVPRHVIDRLLADGHIDAAKAEEFAGVGAVGSHLENLQRRGGFKGFNQHSVSATMAVTDPRVYRESSSSTH